MLETSVTLAELPAAWKNLIARNKHAVIMGLRATARDAKVIARAASPLDQGLFRSSWKVIYDAEGAMLVNDAPHADIIEFGSRPHWPPSAPIRAWVIRKIRQIGMEQVKNDGTGPLMTKTGKARGTRKDSSGEMLAGDSRVVDTLTYLICRKISKEGTKAHHILTSRQLEFAIIMRDNIIVKLVGGG